MLLRSVTLGFVWTGLSLALAACSSTTASPEPVAPAVTGEDAGGVAEPEPEVPACGDCANRCPGVKTCSAEKAPRELSDDEWIGDFHLGGFEYWPYKEPEPLYPDKIRWGFRGGTPQAERCMAAARKELVAILQSPPEELVALRAKHRIQSFFNWNNDYTDAARVAKPLFRGLWLYEEGLIKWISETAPDGTCTLPTREDLVRFAKGCLTTFPNCGAG